MSRILIIEDEASIAELEKDYLEQAGYEAVIEQDGTIGLKRALNHAEGVGEVFQVEIAAQLAAVHDVIAHAVDRLDQAALDAVFRADVMNFPALGAQRGNESEVGRDVAGGAAARQNDLFHEDTPSCRG